MKTLIEAIYSDNDELISDEDPIPIDDDKLEYYDDIEGQPPTGDDLFSDQEDWEIGSDYDYIEEASTTGGIVGFNAPLGSNPAKSKMVDPWEGHRSKKEESLPEDSDEKIRNELATSNKSNYFKKHPIMNIKSKP